MVDVVLTEYYNDIKDESWPDIKTYADFLQLPKHIKQECYDIHNFEQRLSEIEDLDYWKIQRSSGPSIVGLKCNNAIYITNMKCAKTYYTEFFESLGWQTIRSLDSIDLSKYHTFGLIMHPLTRYVKGIAQLLSTGYCQFREDDWKKGPLCFEKVVKDLGTQLKQIPSNIVTGNNDALESYCDKFGDNLYKIDWIPWEYGNVNQFKEWIELYLHTHNIDVTIPRNDKLARPSYPAKKQAYAMLEDLLSKSNSEHKSRLYQYYANDLKFYHRLLERFNPKGKTWEEISWLTNH